MTITVQQLRQIMPHAGSRADLFFHYLDDAMDAFSIDTALRQSAFLATLCVESGSLLYVCEIASGNEYNNRADLGNTLPEAIATAAKYGKTAGAFYKGHGLIQITGYSNHKECGEYLGVDLVEYPTMLMQPEHACNSAAWFWQRHKLNQWADAGDLKSVTRHVNGGLTGYQDRLDAYDRAMVILG